MTKVTQRIMISAPRESVRLYLRDLENAPRFSRRISQVQVKNQDDHTAAMDAAGRFLGFSWKSAAEAEFTTDGGLRLSMVRGPLGLTVSSYRLRSVSGGTIISHEEDYRFPLILRPLGIFLKRILAETMELELRVIKEGAEQLNRKIKLREIESAL